MLYIYFFNFTFSSFFLYIYNFITITYIYIILSYSLLQIIMIQFWSGWAILNRKKNFKINITCIDLTEVNQVPVAWSVH